jgi:hypothetical protein
MLGSPSTLEYWHIGATPMRFFMRAPRQSNGENSCEVIGDGMPVEESTDDA